MTHIPICAFQRISWREQFVIFSLQLRLFLQEADKDPGQNFSAKR